MSYQLHPGALTDREWDRTDSMLPPAVPGGRPRSTDMRLVLDAVLYVGRGGIAWRYLPREYPPWQTVYGYFRRWRLDGVLRRIHDRLRSLVRRAEVRSSQPTAAILDWQSVKTSERGDERGYDAGKEVVSRPAGQKGFQVLPRMWVVEPTFAWLGLFRRLSKDYEALPETSGSMIYVAMIRLMLARLQ